MLPLRQPSDPSDALPGTALTADSALRQLSAHGFVQFHPTLAERLDSYKAALFVGHALYWTRHLARHQPRRKGWFFMTARQWQEATGLTTREQASVRALLAERELLLETVAGRPAKLHYKLNLPALAQSLGLVADQGGALSWEAFAPWLRQCVSFYKPLADVAGSIAAGLYLSYLLQAQRAVAADSRSIDAQGFFKVSQEDIRIALCLGPKVQRNARIRLRSAGLIEERAALLRVRLDRVMAALAGDTNAAPERPEPAAVATTSLSLVQPGTATAEAGQDVPSSLPVREWASAQETAPVPVPRSADLFGADGQPGPLIDDAAASVQRMFAGAALASPASVASKVQDEAEALSGEGCQPFALLSKLGPALLSKLDAEPALLSNQGCPFVESDLPFCRTHIQIQNKRTTTTARARAREAVDNSRFDETAGRRRRNSRIPESDPVTRPVPVPAEPLPGNMDRLVMPRRLDQAWHQAVLGTVARAPEAVRQALLDELDGQLGIEGKTIHNPAGWLHALVRRHASGTLELAMAEKVAADRRERERHLKTLERLQSSAALPPETDGATPAPAELSQAAKDARSKLRALRQEFDSGKAESSGIRPSEAAALGQNVPRGNGYHVGHIVPPDPESKK